MLGLLKSGFLLFFLLIIYINAYYAQCLVFKFLTKGHNHTIGGGPLQDMKSMKIILSSINAVPCQILNVLVEFTVDTFIRLVVLKFLTFSLNLQ